MLRRAQRVRISDAPTKRPVGGRSNPCRGVDAYRHPLAELASIGRPNKRNQQRGRHFTPAWKQFSEAIQRGEIPVGTPITVAMINKAIGTGKAQGGMAMFAMQLSANNEPVRLLELAKDKWVARIL